MTRSAATALLTRIGWPLLVVVGAASAGLAPASDGDVWWHLAAGREMVARGALLFTDPFSVSAVGRPWIDVHWLFQLGSYAVYAALGLAGLVWVKCALVATGAWLLLAALERDRFASWARPLFVTLLVAALLASRQLLLVRPVIVTLSCLALFFYQLERYRLDSKPWRLAVLAVVQVLWANCQGLSALGPALVAVHGLAAGCDAWLGGRARWPFAREATQPGARHVRQLALAFVACVVALAATPFGARGLWLPATLFGRLVPGEHNVYAHAVAENVPPFLLERWSGGEFWHLKWFFAILAVSLVAGGRRLRLSHALLLGGFAVLALFSNRNVLLLYWVATPIAALHLAPAARRLARALSSRRGARLVLAANAAALTALLSLSSVAAAREASLREPSPFRAPIASSERLAALSGGADVFCADHHGGYLIWRLFPRYRPYIDTRLVLRSAQEFAEYLSLADEPERFDAFQRQKRFGYVVLPVAYPDRYLGLIAHLYRSPDWRLIYTDGSEVLFARRDLVTVPALDLADPATTERVLAELEARFAGQAKLLSAARLHLATLNITLGATAQAEAALAGMSEAEAEALKARCRFAAGDLESARAIAARQLARDEDDVHSLSLLARVALEQGELRQSAAFVRRALHIDPFDGEASRLLSSLEESEP
jgi:tetratricopeptide (TPR) repeat protein